MQEKFSLVLQGLRTRNRKQKKKKKKKLSISIEKLTKIISIALLWDDQSNIVLPECLYTLP